MHWEPKNSCDSLYCDICFIEAVWNKPAVSLRCACTVGSWSVLRTHVVCLDYSGGRILVGKLEGVKFGAWIRFWLPLFLPTDLGQDI